MEEIEKEKRDEYLAGEKYIRSFGETKEEIDRFCAEASERAKEILAKLGEVSAKTGRKAPTLLAATKTVSAEVINRVCLESGIKDIGENRVQELMAKYDSLDPSLRVHFIGQLQKNKVKYVVGRASVIHSVDSVALAEEIARRSRALGIITDILIEINIGREECKGGIMSEQLDEFFDRISAFEGIRVLGVMTIAPKESENRDYYKYFEETYQIFIDFSRKKLHNIDNAVLSMGMSGSYVAAAECGSTLVRVGSAIFGQRPALPTA